MSDPVSALGGVSFDGVVSISEADPRGMVTIRGDLSDKGIRNAIAGCLVTAIPESQKLVQGDADALLWMSPDEMMLLCPRDEADARVSTLSEALAGQHCLAINMSDARSVFTLTGDGVAIRETLAKLTPADMRSTALPLGTVRRTRLAQVPAAFWFSAEGEAHLICFRSVAAYVFGILKHAAAQGSEVGYLR